jgi:hypothetical protein
MRPVVRVLGWLCVALAVVLVVIGPTTLPAGGLMFALPYVFLIPGVLLGAAGGACCRWDGARGRSLRNADLRGPDRRAATGGSDPSHGIVRHPPSLEGGGARSGRRP